MRNYDVQDVVTTEELYRELLVWIDNHPNMNLFRPPGDVPVCPKCEQDALQKRGVRRTKASFIERIQCIACGAWQTGKRVLVKNTVAAIEEAA